MSLLKLQNIGKIYVSEGAVAVGIRGVNLSFDIGEFVAITGKSGSGKTTLLNVLSGMDTYEEGEYYVNGEPTSHFVQKDWEKFREEYISFIFQDYNIIDSFTVLQNVELALMGIPTRRERREKALELIDRVGLTDFIRQKGSRLSGGQKQRTVIARALAKDSPIILADEPTGNLDAQTSKEIIALLREISAEKLVIIVTHNFDQVENEATREIRIFDGAVESDRTLRPPKRISDRKKQGKPVTAISAVKKGAELGLTRFRAMPKLSVFLCILMVLASLGTFVVTAGASDAVRAGFTPPYLFRTLPGRVIITRTDGATLTTDELKEAAEKTGALSYLRNDSLYDTRLYLQNYRTYTDENTYYHKSFDFQLEENIETDVGRAPESADEFVLQVPISEQSIFGKDSLLIDTLSVGSRGASVPIKICGVKYYYDNTVERTIVGGQEQFSYLSVIDYLFGLHPYANVRSVTINLTENEDTYQLTISQLDGFCFRISDALTGDDFCFEKSDEKWVLPDAAFTSELIFALGEQVATLVTVEGGNYRADLNIVNPTFSGSTVYLLLSPDLAKKVADTICEQTYTQSSLFYSTEKDAKNSISALRDLGYLAAPSDAASSDPNDMLTAYLEMILYSILWVGVILFLAFVITICTTRSMAATKKDIAILRSMGIHNHIIKISIAFQTGLTMIPSYISLAIFAVVIYSLPQTNDIFPFLHAWQYLLIVLGILLLNLLVTLRYNKKIFKQSVRKTLKGGDAA